MQLIYIKKYTFYEDRSCFYHRMYVTYASDHREVGFVVHIILDRFVELTPIITRCVINYFDMYIDKRNGRTLHKW